MPTYNNALTDQPANRLAYPGGLAKRGGSLDSFVPLDYSRLAAGQFRQDTPQMREYAANVPIDVMRGRLAGMLGFPSDVLNMFRTPSPMEMFGQTDYEQPTQVPYGSEQLLKTLPLAPAENNPLGRVANRAGSLVPFTPMEALQAARLARQAAMATGRAGERYAERVVPQIMERGGLGAEMLGAMSNRTISPLDVYHGSPHRLPPTERNPLGEFDASKIGTGEGAQAYGHGIYTAESRPVAEGYAKNVKDMASIGKMNAELSRLSKVMDADSQGGYRKFKSNIGEDAAKLYDQLMTERNKVSTATGNLYKVDLPDEMIPKMLDYDKHLSEQSFEVQKILLPYQKEIGSSFGTGEQTLKAIAFERRMKGLDDSPAAVAEQLRQMGIPGIKYFDAQSRPMPNITNSRLAELYAKNDGNAEAAVDEFMRSVYNTPKKKAEMRKQFLKELETPKTRNFVTFPGEEKNLTILERNGQKATRTNNLAPQ